MDAVESSAHELMSIASYQRPGKIVLSAFRIRSSCVSLGFSVCEILSHSVKNVLKTEVWVPISASLPSSFESLCKL